MKHWLIIVLLIGIVMPMNGQFETKKLAVESNHSTLLFSVPISNGITRITGKFNDYTVELDLNEDDFTKSTLAVTIKVASIDTGIDSRDEHLQSADFFDVENHPHITFVSKKVVKSENGYIVIGAFTMRGVTKEMELPLVFTGRDGKNTFGFSSRLSLNRADYGVGTSFKHDSMDNFIGEMIDVEIDFWTKKRKSPKKTEEKK